MKNYKVKADNKLIEKMIAPILSFLKKMDVDNKKIYQINLVLEEILVNICNYAYLTEDGVIDISFDVEENPKKLRVVIKDSGISFNPLEKEDPDLHIPSKDRQIGGLGIFLIKNMVDNIKYQRINNENILEFIKYL